MEKKSVKKGIQRRDFLMLTGAGAVASATGASLYAANNSSLNKAVNIIYLPQFKEMANNASASLIGAGVASPNLIELSKDLVLNPIKLRSRLTSLKGQRIIAFNDYCSDFWLSDALMETRAKIKYTSSHDIDAARNVNRHKIWAHSSWKDVASATNEIFTNIGATNFISAVSLKLALFANQGSQSIYGLSNLVNNTKQGAAYIGKITTIIADL